MLGLTKNDKQMVAIKWYEFFLGNEFLLPIQSITAILIVN